MLSQDSFMEKCSEEITGIQNILCVMPSCTTRGGDWKQKLQTGTCDGSSLTLSERVRRVPR